MGPVVFLLLQVGTQLLCWRAVEGGGSEWERRVAVVTGANRGIGFATVKVLCRNFDGHVYLTSRSERNGRTAIRRLMGSKCYPIYYRLDITDRKTVVDFRDHLIDSHGGLDVLINNAGKRFEPNCSVDFQVKVRSTLHVNFYSTLYVCRTLFPILRRHARVVNLSGDCGHLQDLPSAALRRKVLARTVTNKAVLDFIETFRACVTSEKHMGQGWGDDPYCISKIAVTLMTVAQQSVFYGARPLDDMVVNCYNPGNIRSHVMEYAGNVSCKRAAVNIVRLAMLPVNVTEPRGQLVWHDMTVVDYRGAKPGY